MLIKFFVTCVFLDFIDVWHAFILQYDAGPDEEEDENDSDDDAMQKKKHPASQRMRPEGQPFSAGLILFYLQGICKHVCVHVRVWEREIRRIYIFIYIFQIKYRFCLKCMPASFILGLDELPVKKIVQPNLIVLQQLGTEREAKLEWQGGWTQCLVRWVV